MLVRLGLKDMLPRRALATEHFELNDWQVIPVTQHYGPLGDEDGDGEEDVGEAAGFGIASVCPICSFRSFSMWLYF